jgi:hypothetical protein
MVGAMLTLAKQSLQQVRRPHPLPVGFRESNDRETFLQVCFHPPARKRAVKKIASAFAFEDRHELLLVLRERAQHGVGDFAVHFDVPFPRRGEGVRRFGRAGVVEQGAEDVGEEIREQGGFLEIVRPAGSDEAGPVLELGLPALHALRQVESPDLLAEDFRVEERFGFEGRWDLRFTIYERRAKRKTAVLGKPVFLDTLRLFRPSVTFGQDEREIG